MGDLHVKLSNGDVFKVFTDADGTRYYIDNGGTKKKVRRNQQVTKVQPDVVEGATGGLKLPTDLELFRAPLPPAQDIWDANSGIDKYTGFSQGVTEKMEFGDLSRVVKKYEHFNKARAIKVERDHTVEVQMVSRA